MILDPDVMLYEVMFTRGNIRVAETVFYNGQRCLDCFTVHDHAETGERVSTLWAWAYADNDTDTWDVRYRNDDLQKTDGVFIEGYEDCLEALLKAVKE